MKVPFSGEMNVQVEFFENTEAKNASGELVPTEQTLGKKMAKRTDGSGSENLDGRLEAMGTRNYQLRFDTNIAARASELFIRDVDGDWQVHGPIQLLDGRNRYMQINCRKRGEG